MKINIKNIGLTAVLLMALASCSDVVDYVVPDKTVNHGAPSITSIYDVKDTGYVSPLSGGMLNQMLHIKGQNLAKVKKITFNNLEVDIRQVYAESDEAWVKIPRIIPEVQNDILYYETEQGSYTMTFPVTIPQVSISGLRNEFALQGNEVQLNSEYMDLYGFNDTTETSPATIYIENVDSGYRQTIHCDSCTENYTSIVIPADCPDNSLIHFAWNEIDGPKTATIPYRMSKSLLFGNFSSDMGWWNADSKALVAQGGVDGAPESLGYNFLRVKGTYSLWAYNGWGWGANWLNDDAAAHPENYVLKFEVCSNSSTPYYSYGDNGKNGSRNGGYNITLNSGSKRCQWDPVSDGITNTYGRWITVSIPLVDALGGSTATPGSWYSCEFVLQPNSGDAWTVDHSFGQFRIEPKNY